MIKKRTFLVGALAALAMPARAEGGAFAFPSIDGGTLDLAAWRGRPVLVVNTASRCGFTRQYDGLQALYDRYRAAGLVVLAVPSNDFRQELASATEVKEFCEVNFGLTLPMTDLTRVKGPQAHPFYQWLRESAGFVPRWNFNKVLLDGNGAVVGTYGSSVKPLSPKLTQAVEAALRSS